MKRHILTAAVVLGLAALPAAATEFSVGGAYWDTKDADQALGVTSKLGFGLLELRGSYFSDVTADTEPERRDFEISAIPLEAGLKWDFAEEERVNPYVGGGIGYYLLDTSRGDIDDEVGWYAVGGVDIATQAGFGINLEAIYRGIEATVDNVGGDNDIRDDVGLDLDGLGLNAGLVWKF
jgi:opacity protein-like surface antigen